MQIGVASLVQLQDLVNRGVNDSGAEIQRTWVPVRVDGARLGALAARGETE